MNATKSELKKEFDRAVRLGWLPYFIEAAKTYTSGFFDESDLLAIGSRETNLDPKWLTKAGDNGHGYGLLQADVRSFPEWIKSGKWKEPSEGILMGARVLMMKWADIQACTGKDATVWSSKAQKFFHFVGKKVSGAEAQKTTISAYNSGRWAHYAVSNKQDADKYSTGSDYAGDVMERAAYFRPLFADWKNTNLKPDEDNPLVGSAGGSTDADNSAGNDSSNAGLKEFSDKYLKHCPADTVKNIAVVAGARVSGGIFTLWMMGIHDQIFLIALGILVLAIAGYILYKYHGRIFGWIKTLTDSFLGN